MDEHFNSNNKDRFCAEVVVKKHFLAKISDLKDKICTIFKLISFNVPDLKNLSDKDENVSIQIVSDSSCKNIEETAKHIQNYIDCLAIAEGEDSSYDSDCENEETNNLQKFKHEQVCRTVSDTLGQEFAEYVTHRQQPYQQQQPQQQQQSSTSITERSSNYIARVEFALKLGYTERLVQAALARLGPDPAQNELLAELIKLGAQNCNKNDFGCETQTSECLSSTNGSTNLLTTTAITNDNLNYQQIQTNNLNDDLTINNLLRPIVIDGSNVAMSHGNKEIFSCRGIKLCVDWFKNRGHKDITVFVPKWRKESSRPDNPIKDQDILNELEKERMLVFTPSRLVGGKRMVCYDDRYILKLAVEEDGIVVSNDTYRDLVQESSEFKKVVEERILMYSFVNDRFMPPDDPLGRSGPTLENFLRIQPKKGDPPPLCPYGKKCTYGNKCKFHHPERGLGPHKSVTERLSEHAAKYLSARNSLGDTNRLPVQGKSFSVPLNSSSNDNQTTERISRKALCRTRSGAPDYNSLSCNNIVPNTNLQQNQIKTQQIATTTQTIPSHLIDAQQKLMKFSKSHSIENISHENYPNGQIILTHQNYPTNSIWQKNIQASAKNVEKSVDETINLHRKLRRQLTLNPAGCDPRIYEMQRCISHRSSSGSNQNQITAAASASTIQKNSSHRPLAPSLSGPRIGTHNPTQWDMHQSVTRIASAPDQSRTWHTYTPASLSEPHINLWPHHTSPTVLAAQDQRRRLHYHLSSIFPETHVQTVMQMYPEETNPQNICAAILNIFPKI